MNLNSVRISTVRGHAPCPGTNLNPLRISWSDTSVSPTDVNISAPATHCNTLQHTATYCNRLYLWLQLPLCQHMRTSLCVPATARLESVAVIDVRRKMDEGRYLYTYTCTKEDICILIESVAVMSLDCSDVTRRLLIQTATH